MDTKRPFCLKLFVTLDKSRHHKIFNIVIKKKMTLRKNQFHVMEGGKMIVISSSKKW